MNKTLAIFLILAVTVILLALLFTANQSVLAILAVTIILVTLILVVGGSPALLPRVLKIILSELGRILHP